VTVVRHLEAAGPAWAVVRGEEVIGLEGDYPTTADLLGAGGAELADPAGPRRARAGLALLSPVTTPCQVLAQGINYTSHLRESGLDPHRPPFNLLFRKSWAAISGPEEPIVRPAAVRLLDHEIEIGLVLGAAIDSPRRVTPADLPELVGALVVANDVSARDVQLPQGQWYKGKSYRTFCPVGPYLFVPTRDDLARLAELELTLAVNGEVRQRGRAAEMVFGPHDTLTELSELEVLAPGDLVLTGTPGGVGMRLPPGWVQRLVGLLPDRRRWELFVRSQRRTGRYLSPGDVVEATIRTPDGSIDLGTQRTPVVAASA
jgi:2-keto-4-pentenoate hydratase/2-oxohepta-3-ene-1,7-dioic acid hydratase in catechol pathway